MRKYTKTESGRIEVYKKLHDSLSEEYDEQTPIGNIYNSYIEFLMAQDIVKDIATKDDFVSNEILRSGLQKSYYEALDFLKKEK